LDDAPSYLRRDADKIYVNLGAQPPQRWYLKVLRFFRHFDRSVGRHCVLGHTMGPFQYQPLQPNDNQIRLLRFSDDSGSQLGYALDSFDLNKCPPYEALSYTWGPPLPTKIITLNEMSFEIRENLSDFLDHIRIGITLLDEDDCSLPHPKYLWIDQLCVDQSSQKEKSHQVKRMDEIFKQAQRVILWLGRDDQHSGTAMRLMADTWFIEKIPQSGPPNFPGGALWLALHNKHQDYLQRLLNDRHSIENLLRRSYWNRLWIVQEFVLARDLLLACGPCALTLTAISRLRSISSLPMWFARPKFITIPQPVVTLLDARCDRSAGVTFSLPELHLITLLRDFSTRECENPRDKVYGLLALCNDKVEVNVDYSRPADEIFREVFSTLIYFKGYDEVWFLQLAKDMGVK
jgi:hypothetical protein